MQDLGLSQNFLKNNMKLYDINGKILKKNTMGKSITDMSSVDSLLEEDSDDIK